MLENSLCKQRAAVVEGRCSRVEGSKGPECVSNVIATNEPEGMFEEFGRRSTRHTGTRSAQSRTECELGTVRYRHQPFKQDLRMSEPLFFAP
jgi:hypothetical protein